MLTGLQGEGLRWRHREGEDRFEHDLEGPGMMQQRRDKMSEMLVGLWCVLLSEQWPLLTVLLNRTLGPLARCTAKPIY